MWVGKAQQISDPQALVISALKLGHAETLVASRAAAHEAPEISGVVMWAQADLEI